jgi:very-short-patch-repair endonuclease
MPRVVYEPLPDADDVDRVSPKRDKRHVETPSYPKSKVRAWAEFNAKHPTSAESRLEAFLASAIPGRYLRQHVVSGNWIADFFVPEIRLAIEVDGPIHSSLAQQERDALKTEAARKFDVTIVRITNDEVFGDRGALRRKLRDAWRRAQKRKNQIVGVVR